MDVGSALEQAVKMVKEGAEIVDIGASSSRPGSIPVDADTEIRRLTPVVEALRHELPDVLISVDTFRAEVARISIENGAHIINDISAGEDDIEMLKTVSKYKVPYIAMHKLGSTETMQLNPEYDDVTAQIIQYFNEKVSVYHKAGIRDIIIDPGFGFGKSVEHNYTLLRELSSFNRLIKKPVLVGLSRKSMINKVLGIKSADALNGTTALNTIAILNGASILRVHDVAQAKEVINLINAYFQ